MSEPHSAQTAPQNWDRFLPPSNACSTGGERRGVCGAAAGAEGRNAQFSRSDNHLPDLRCISSSNTYPETSDYKVNRRAFLKCRPNYGSMALDLTQRPHSLEWVEVLPVLQKVSILKDRLKLADVLRFLPELSRLHRDQLLMLKKDQRFLMLFRFCKEHIHLFSALELLEVMQSFVWLKIPHYHSVLDACESELSRQACQMSLHQLLFAADMLHCIGRQPSPFLLHVCRSVQLLLGEMGVPELVQLWYLMGEGRHCPNTLVQPLEHLLIRHLHQLHPEEIGTVCLGLFKTQTSISESTVIHLVDSALTYVTELSDFAIVNVNKYMRFSYLFHKRWLEAMAQEVPRRVNKMAVQGLMHVTLTCSALHYQNSSILNSIAERVPSLVSHCRSKDAGKLLWSFGTLGYLPTQNPAFYSSLTEALRQRKSEFQHFPEHLLTGLLGLAFVSQFPEDLIALALSPKYVELAMRKAHVELRRDLFTLDETVALELPQYTGPRLDSEIKEEVAEMLWNFVQLDVCQRPDVQEAESVLKDLLGGEQYVCKRMILPHTRTIDLEVHLDPKGQPIPVNPPPAAPSNQEWVNLNTGVTITDQLFTQLTNAKSPPNSPASSAGLNPGSSSSSVLMPDERGRLFESALDVTPDITKARLGTTQSVLKDLKRPVKVAVQVPGRNQFCVQSQQLLGLHAMKRRHLKLAGYQVVELSPDEWSVMYRKRHSMKLGYLHCKIYECLK
uniref:FAST kinase domains 5 n=1 Tax=Kryptolebias marmoratus TaxID=37003 RepID=A0A3Q3B117_KRYMA